MGGAAIETTLELSAASPREVEGRMRPLFAQERAAVSASLFLDGLLSDERRKTGWMRAEAAGDPGPWRQQTVLGRSRWDADALRDVVRDYALETLADLQAVLVIDETGFLKQGKASYGVARQYTGSAGKITDCQIGVFAAYVSRRGRAFIDRAMDLPKVWMDDPARLTAAHVSDAAGLPGERRCGADLTQARPAEQSQDPDSLRKSALAIVRERYADFGPTFAAEKLAALHEIEISHETLRKWMIADGLWLDRQRRLKRAYQPRYRRDCVGELVQVDGSEHRWFEDRGLTCTLLVFIDDATSRLTQLRFAPPESTFSYFAATRTYLEAYGKPITLYTDKHGVFRVNRPDAVGGDGLTQYGRVLYNLNIDLICANSSQAKGRVERANKTLQDRLVKELRLTDISNMDDGNAFLPRFMADYSARFAKPPANFKDLHRPLAARDNLNDALCWRETRHVSQSLTVHYDRTAYILEQSPLSLAAAGKDLEVIEFAEGPVILRFQGVDLPYRMFDKERRVDQAAIVDNKRLGPLLELIRAEQLKRDAGERPRRSSRPVRKLRVG